MFSLCSNGVKWAKTPFCAALERRAIMKTEQHVAQMGADIAIQLMLTTLFRIVADLGDDPNSFLFVSIRFYRKCVRH
jgi:hypothetical protein